MRHCLVEFLNEDGKTARSTRWAPQSSSTKSRVIVVVTCPYNEMADGMNLFSQHDQTMVTATNLVSAFAGCVHCQ